MATGHVKHLQGPGFCTWGGREWNGSEGQYGGSCGAAVFQVVLYREVASSTGHLSSGGSVSPNAIKSVAHVPTLDNAAWSSSPSVMWAQDFKRPWPLSLSSQEVVAVLKEVYVSNRLLSLAERSLVEGQTVGIFLAGESSREKYRVMEELRWCNWVPLKLRSSTEAESSLCTQTPN